jgi:hypothetical protein
LYHFYFGEGADREDIHGDPNHDFAACNKNFVKNRN